MVESEASLEDTILPAGVAGQIQYAHREIQQSVRLFQNPWQSAGGYQAAAPLITITSRPFRRVAT